VSQLWDGGAWIWQGPCTGQALLEAENRCLASGVGDWLVAPIHRPSHSWPRHGGTPAALRGRPSSEVWRRPGHEWFAERVVRKRGGRWRAPDFRELGGRSIGHTERLATAMALLFCGVSTIQTCRTRTVHNTLEASSMAARVSSTPRGGGLWNWRPCAVSVSCFWAGSCTAFQAAQKSWVRDIGGSVKICKSCRRGQPCREGADGVRRDDKSRQSKPAGRDIRALGPRDMFVSFVFHASVSGSLQSSD
jgi:hypothetical protein